jgi:hypothetical protein
MYEDLGGSNPSQESQAPFLPAQESPDFHKLPEFNQMAIINKKIAAAEAKGEDGVKEIVDKCYPPVPFSKLGKNPLSDNCVV